MEGHKKCSCCSHEECERELRMQRLIEQEQEGIRRLHTLIDEERDVVERTACQTAAGRALWKHVIEDPVAELLAGENCLKHLRDKMEMAKLSNPRETPGVLLAVRTLWFDSRLEAALHRFKGETQVVLLGAGMDARAYRLKFLKESTIYEVDLPKIVDLKNALLEVVSQTGKQHLPCHAKAIHRIAADITKKDWLEKLLKLGFLLDRSTVWILEGILYYLHDLHAKDVLRSISEKSLGDTILLADFMNECAISLSHELKTNFQFYSDWPEELLPTLGYSQVQVSQIGDSDANFGLLQDPLCCFNKLRNVPRCMKRDSEGMPCRRLYLVECTVVGRSACSN